VSAEIPSVGKGEILAMAMETVDYIVHPLLTQMWSSGWGGFET
jgi:hypothetical protein